MRMPAQGHTGEGWRKMQVVKLFEGDQRHETVVQAVKAALYERCEGMPMASVLGILEIVKIEITKEQA